MAGKVSQKSIVAMKRIFDVCLGGSRDIREILYENGFPDWLIRRSQEYARNWIEVLWDLRNGTFFFARGAFCDARPITQAMDDPHWDGDFADLGESYIQRLAAFACTQATTESLLRQLQLDGFDVNTRNLTLVPIEGPVSAQEEEGRLTQLVKSTGLPQSQAVLKHIEDAFLLYTEGNYHPSLGESRNIIQALIDGISTETAAQAKHSTKLPGPMKDRIEYLTKVGSSYRMRKHRLSPGGAVFQPDHIPVCQIVSRRESD
jgi:hypothetical protein